MRSVPFHLELSNLLSCQIIFETLILQSMILSDSVRRCLDKKVFFRAVHQLHQCEPFSDTMIMMMFSYFYIMFLEKLLTTMPMSSTWSILSPFRKKLPFLNQRRENLSDQTRPYSSPNIRLFQSILIVLLLLKIRVCFIMTETSYADPESFVRGGPKFFLVGEFPNTTISRSSSYRQRNNAIWMAFRWRADDDPTLNVG